VLIQAPRHGDVLREGEQKTKHEEF